MVKSLHEAGVLPLLLAVELGCKLAEAAADVAEKNGEEVDQMYWCTYCAKEPLKKSAAYAHRDNHKDHRRSMGDQRFCAYCDDKFGERQPV